ncbi:MAG: sulfur carrier protein ThiS [Nitrospirota bacterium]|nr:sulfur carrier protein ThiS [Nitrospirota bacterium]
MTVFLSASADQPGLIGMRFFVFMRLIINGEDLEVSKAETLQELLGELHIKPERVAVEVNLSIIKKSDYGSCRLKDGDSIEIVNFVGGGQWKIN